MAANLPAVAEPRAGNIVEARDLDQAVEVSLGCPMLQGSGSVEVRPVARGPM